MIDGALEDGEVLNLLEQPEAGDWVVATGETRSVRDMCKYVFSSLGLDYKDYVVQNQKFLRPEELKYLKGDSTRIRELGWKPEYSLQGLVDDMMNSDLKLMTQDQYLGQPSHSQECL